MECVKYDQQFDGVDLALATGRAIGRHREYRRLHSGIHPDNDIHGDLAQSGRWSVGARGRYFGPRPLVEDNSVRSASSFLVNLKVGYQDMKNHRVFAEVLNVFGKRANDFVVVWSF